MFRLILGAFIAHARPRCCDGNVQLRQAKWLLWQGSFDSGCGLFLRPM